MRKNLQHITLKTQTEHSSLIVDKDETFMTSEGIPFKENYSKRDIEDLDHLDFAAGITPYLRGAYSTMYVKQPWIINQYSNLSTVEDSNTYLKKNLNTGQNKLAITFDFTTSASPNFNHKKEGITHSEKAEISIDSVEDMKILFDQIPLDKTTVSMSTNAAILPLLAFFIVTAEEQGVKPEQLAGSIQNDISKHLIPNNESINLPGSSINVISDILEFTSKNMPKFNSINILGCPVQNSNSCDIELAYTLASGLEYLKKGILAGLDIDKLAPNLCFSWNIGMNHFMEIAKMRAARMLWAKLVKPFHPKNQNSSILRTYCKTSNDISTKEDPFNHVARTTIEAAAAVFGGTQSLHTYPLNKGVQQPKQFSERLAKNTQLYLQEETQITKTVDPWAGSYFIENLTADIAKKTWDLIEEIEATGGIEKAIKAGIIPNLSFKEIANKKQNKTELIKGTRNSEKVNTALSTLAEASRLGQNNVLTLAIEAARERATLHEISNALEIDYFNT